MKFAQRLHSPSECEVHSELGNGVSLRPSPFRAEVDAESDIETGSKGASYAVYRYFKGTHHHMHSGFVALAGSARLVDARPGSPSDHPGQVESDANLAELAGRRGERIVPELLLDGQHGHAWERQVGRVCVRGSCG